jgi:O-antigen ligase
MTHGFGGRTPGPLSWGLVVALPALVLSRPWSRYPRSSLLAAVVAVAAIGVCLVAPTGWAGADVAAGYVYAALVAVVVASYARTTGRRTLLAVAIVLAGIEQFGHALQAWAGSGDSSTAMVGTFYWHNQFAAFLVAPALLGATLAATATNKWVRVVGFVGAPVAIAGVVFSSSRATLTVLVIGFAMLTIAAVRAGRNVVLRLVAVGVLGVAFTLALPGPPLFSHWRSPLAATEERAAAGETVSANGEYRTQFWREAVDVTRAHPLTGAGYHALGSASELTSPASWARSSWAHNGFLQAASDGGALLAIPFGAGCLVLGLAALGALRRSRMRLTAEAGVTLAAAVAALGLFAHSAVDFDWSYPGLFAMTGVVAAIAAANRDPGRRTSSALRRTSVVGVAVLAVVALVSGVALRSWARTDRVAHNGAAASGQTPQQLIARSAAAFGDYRPAAAVLRQADQGQAVPNELLRTAWRRTASAAAVDPLLAALRARALVLLGRRIEAERAVGELLAALGPANRAGVAGDLAVSLHLMGDDAAAQHVLGPVLATDVSAHAIGRIWADVAAAQMAGLLTDNATAACVVQAAHAIAGPPPANHSFGPERPGPPSADCSARLAALAR